MSEKTILKLAFLIFFYEWGFKLFPVSNESRCDLKEMYNLRAIQVAKNGVALKIVSKLQNLNINSTCRDIWMI